jgi:uncharacterized protein
VDRKLSYAATLINSDDPEDVKSGVAAVKASFNDGDPLAIYAIGTWHLHGVHGYGPDEARGVQLIGKAANLGVAAAAQDYAYALEHGRSVRRDLRAALSYYLLAALGGESAALHDVARFFDEGLGCRRNKQRADLLFALYERMIGNEETG